MNFKNQFQDFLTQMTKKKKKKLQAWHVYEIFLDKISGTTYWTIMIYILT